MVALRGWSAHPWNCQWHLGIFSGMGFDRRLQLLIGELSRGRPESTKCALIELHPSINPQNSSEEPHINTTRPRRDAQRGQSPILNEAAPGVVVAASIVVGYAPAAAAAVPLAGLLRLSGMA